MLAAPGRSRLWQGAGRRGDARMPVHSGWTHDAAFRALWALNGVRKTANGSYAWLYGQSPNSAVLYAPDSKVRNRPLHLRPESPSARQQLFAALEACTELRYRENRESKPGGFDWYAVTDWNGFAKAVGLPSSPAA